MAWPFTTPGAPNFEIGPDAVVPVGALVAVDTVQLWILGGLLRNDAAVSRTITITNTAGNVLWKRTVPAGGELPYDPPFRPTLGLKWSADGAGMVGHIWGYK